MDADTGVITTTLTTGAGTATATGMGTTDSGGDATSASTGSSGDGDGGDGDGDTSIPVCQLQCASVLDCAPTPGTSTAFDEDNYACESGGCVYTGCNSDAECAASVPGTLCREVPGTGVLSCLTACASAAECAITGGGPAFDADNYECQGSLCVYLGCNSDAECQATQPNSACITIAGASQSACPPTCSTNADCDQGLPAFDADNYACENGGCTYTGCNSDAECPSGQVCRG
jgi:hypothetical protein